MAETPQHEPAAIAQFWSQLDGSRIVMLWAPGSGQHPQPMSHHADAKEGAIWFITSSETDLARAVGQGAQGAFTLATPGQDYQSSVKGRMTIVDRPDKLDEIWSPMAGAWFSEGRDDPRVRLIRFDPEEASVWASSRNILLVGAEMVKARVTGKDPDVGTHHILDLAAAA